MNKTAKVLTALAASFIDPGSYTLQVRVTDSDRNTILGEVNADDTPANNTCVSLTLQ